MDKRIIAVVVALVFAAGLGVGLLVSNDSGDDDRRATPASSTSRSDAPSATSTSVSAAPSTMSCTTAVRGYRVEYPAGWYVDESNPALACGLFDPEPFTVEPNTEFPEVAVTIGVEPGVAYADIVTGNTDPTTWRVLERRDITVDGFPAVVLETEQIDELLLPAGTYWYQVVIDRPGAATLVYTTGLPGADYDANRSTLDAMVASLRFT